jgi:hypothetical protein
LRLRSMLSFFVRIDGRRSWSPYYIMREWRDVSVKVTYEDFAPVARGF